MKIKEIYESKNIIKKLYHGTCDDHAKKLIKNGWKPNSVLGGGNVGQTKYLYVTDEPENAKWFANEKGCDVIIELNNIPINFLGVDPEDGISDTVEEELKLKTPASLILKKSLPKKHFKIYKI